MLLTTTTFFTAGCATTFFAGAAVLGLGATFTWIQIYKNRQPTTMTPTQCGESGTVQGQ